MFIKMKVEIAFAKLHTYIILYSSQRVKLITKVFHTIPYI